MTQSTLDKDQFLFLAIRLGRRIAHLLRQRMDETEQHLIGPHIGILADLKHHDGVKQQNLAVSSLRDKATITRAIRGLTEEGLVDRVVDPADKRSKLIYLTPKGRALQERAQQHGHDLLALATQDIDTQALASCLSVLNKMYENLK